VGKPEETISSFFFKNKIKKKSIELGKENEDQLKIDSLAK
jgi:hypothetical protein